MAGSSLLLLLDDIAAVLDDVALMTKVAARKTAGVLGDDLAVNAEKVSGVRADRELPVVWAVAKGSFRNKCILIPAALAISVVAPWLITPALILGGLYLCFEGFEKVVHSFGRSAHRDGGQSAERMEHLLDESVDLVKYEQDKIKGAVRTDFILSAEIIVLTLGVASEMTFLGQALVLSGIGLLMTVGVYGLVAAIVKLDDAGLFLTRRQGDGAFLALQRWFGERLLGFAPWLMKALGVVGTLAMFMVGGGILVHGFDQLTKMVETFGQQLSTMPVAGALLAPLAPTLIGMIVGVIAGALVLGAVNLGRRLRGGDSS
ncbi:MAG: DUF808 domain-containing protein [Halioglobus sp.]|nr:DUF808 domain-containing protein [Halioglobus sp.]